MATSPSPAYRLPPDLQSDLSWYWCEAESELGVRSSTGSQIARLEIGAGSKAAIREAVQKNPDLRFELTTPEPDPVVRRRKLREAKLRYSLLFGPVHDSRECRVYDPFPEGGEHARQRMRLIHDALHRLGRSDGGPGHQRILFRVYGPRSPHLPSYGLVGSELAPLVEYTGKFQGLPPKTKLTEETLRGIRRQAAELLAQASTAYLAHYRAAKRERRDVKRARFRSQVGV